MSPAAPRRSRRRRSMRRTWPQRLVLAGCSVLGVLTLLSALFLSASFDRVEQIRTVEVPLGSAGMAGQDEVTGGIVSSEPGGAKNFLLVGVDSSSGLASNDPVLAGRGGEQNSDTIMVLRVDPDSRTAAMLSLPRDLWVPIGGPDNSRNRINTALATGGPGMLVKTLTDSLKIPIDHYLEIDLAGFKQLVAAINGVPMEFRYPTQDPATGLYQPDPGCVTLDADQALAFARSRKLEIIRPGTQNWVPDGGDDRARARRQQEFIRAAIKKAISRGARNPGTLNEMLNIGLKSVTVDSFLTTGELIDLVGSLKDLDPAAIDTYEPVTEEGWAGPAAVLYLQEKASQPIFEIFRGHNPLKDLRPFIRVEVRSATGVADGAAAVGDELRRNQFTVTATRDDNAFRGMPTRILYADDSEKVSAVVLARYLGIDVPIERGTMWAGDSRVALVVGTDYPGILPEARPLEQFTQHLPPAALPAAGDATTAETAAAPSPFAVPDVTVTGEIPTAPQGCE